MNMEEHLNKDQEQIRNKIIAKNGIKPRIIANYIVNGDITQDQAKRWLNEAGKADFISELQDELDKKREEKKAEDDLCWKEVKDYLENTENLSYKDAKEKLEGYYKKYPTGFHVPEYKDELKKLEDGLWEATQKALENKDEVKNYSESEFEEYAKRILKRYLDVFSEGLHKDCLEDMDWLKTKHKHTIEDYESYIKKHPGKHDDEAKEAIDDIKDEKAWENVNAQKTFNAKQKAAKKYYEHPIGKCKYKSDAKKIIDESDPDAKKTEILEALGKNPNAYPAKTSGTVQGLQEIVNNKILSWEDLKGVFNSDGEQNNEQIEAIKKYKGTIALESGEAPKKLKAGPTEVYFWGLPASGKTCALGALLSAANKRGLYCGKPTPGSGGKYRDQLSGLFKTEGICELPASTPDDSIQQMVFTLRDKNNKKHLINFIDLAGELFKTVYTSINDQPTFAEWKKQGLNKVTAMERTLGYLKNTSQKKIHFFIVAYGDDSKVWDNVTMGSYLDCMADYLKDHKIIKKGTSGVYILVTKCDIMSCSEEKEKYEEQKVEAKNYIEKHLNSFYKNLEEACEEAGVKDLEIIPFSVGDVFAQQLCRFNYKYTERVLGKLILKTPVKRFWDFLNF